MMNSGHEKPPNREEHDRFFIVSGEEMNRIVASLAVAHGYVQLMRRRLSQDGIANDDMFARALVRIEDATRSMAAELWDIMSATSSPMEERDES